MAIEVEGYADIAEVARGGFGVVYRARQVGFDRVVALKVLPQLHGDRDAVRRWERECRALGALSWHPNIVVVYDLGTTAEDDPYLAMEFLDEGSLADRVVSHGARPWPEAVSMIIQVAGALQAAHDAGLLHRDLKPENILIGHYGEAKLSDFGLATSAQTVATAAGMASFTLAHASPEALRGERVGQAGDVYSLGSTLFHLLTGHPPFVRETDDNVLAAVTRTINDPVPDLRASGVPDPVAVAVETAMAKDPAQRPSAADLSRTLQQAQAAFGVSVTEMRLDPRGPSTTGSPPDPSTADPAPTASTASTGTVASGETVDLPAVPSWSSGSGETVVSGPAPAVAAPPPAAPAAPVAFPSPEPAGSAAPPTPPTPPGPPTSLTAPPTEGGRATRSRLPLVLGAVVLVLVVVVAAVLLTRDDDGGGDAGGGGAGGDNAVDQNAGGAVGEVVATVAVGTTPRGVAVADGAAWVANRDDGTVSRVDTDDDKVTDTTTVGEGPRDVAVGLGSVWVTSLEAQEVAKLDPANGTVKATVSFSGGPQAVTTAAGLVWVTDRADESVEAIDPNSLETVDEIKVGADPTAIVADGDDFLWVTNRDEGTLSKISIADRAVVGTFDVGTQPGEAAVDDSSVWLASEGTSSVLRLDKDSGEIVATLDIGERVEGVAIDDDGHPWVDGLSDLIEIDPDANQVLGQVDVGGELREVASGEGSLWTTPHDGNVLTRVDPS